MPILPFVLAIAPVEVTRIAKAAKTSEAGCQMPPGWGEIERLHPRYVVFGEQHGTREAPAFVADVVCALALRGKRVLLAIEHEVIDDPALRRAWSLPHNRFAGALLRTAWTPTEDGRDSEAMFEMVDRLHQVKARGAAISITAFNGMRDEAQEKRWSHLPSQGPHEAAQAENIHIAAARGKYDYVIVLTGGFHASRRSVGDGGSRFDAMASHLARSGRTVSLNLRSSTGTAWNCSTKPGVHIDIGRPLPPGAIECASFPYQDRPDLHRAPYMHIGALPGEDVTPDYNGFFWVGRTTGSAPKKKQ